MKMFKRFTASLAVLATAAWNLGAAETLPATPPDQEPVEQPPASAQPAPQPEPATEIGEPAPATAPADNRGQTEPRNLRMNFRNAPLELVLDYLSEAAGFIIVKETEVRGKVDVWSNTPLTREEAVDLLNSMLNKNGYAAIRRGRTLTITTRENAKTRDIPVITGGDPNKIPQNDEIVTQIIPVRHANVNQLLTNLRPLIGSYAEISVNESANALIVVATQSDIRRLTQIINGLDESISGTSVIRVFPLRYADAKELANVVKELFPTDQRGRGNTRGFAGLPGDVAEPGRGSSERPGAEFFQRGPGAEFFRQGQDGGDFVRPQAPQGDSAAPSGGFDADAIRQRLENIRRSQFPSGDR